MKKIYMIGILFLGSVQIEATMPKEFALSINLAAGIENEVAMAQHFVEPLVQPDENDQINDDMAEYNSDEYISDDEIRHRLEAEGDYLSLIYFNALHE